MIVVTGGAGFIGSHLVLGLNKTGANKIVVVDNLKNEEKNKNLIEAKIVDYIDKIDFLKLIEKRDPFCEDIDFIFHQGACTVTTEWDGRYMLENNFRYSKVLLNFCLERSIPFIYASSAAVYGINSNFAEKRKNEGPINIYGYSKWLFDQYVRSLKNKIKSQVVGLRYFNVFGPGEAHKNNMASVVYHFDSQINEMGELKLFKGSHGYDDGEQRRDFIFVDDVIKINLWMMNNSNISGIYNVGTGKSHSFNDIANAVIKRRKTGRIKYIPFPKELEESYQSYTEANLENLRSVGYEKEFIALDEGVSTYLDAIY